MKLRLLLFAVTVMFASCSGDDNSETINEPVAPVLKDLNTIAVRYYAGARIGSDFFIMENNKLIKSTGSYGGHADYYYNEDGLLIEKEVFDNTGNVDTRYTIQYDSEGRITEKLYELLLGTTPESFTDVYTYNADNTITSVTYGTNNQQAWTRIFYKNASGQINKIVWNRADNDVLIQELFYDVNNNVQSLEKHGVESIFSYDLETPVLGQFHNLYLNQFGTNNNIILYENHFLFEGLLNFNRVNTANYITSENKGDDHFTYTYEFDEDGYPVVKNVYNNGVLNYIMEITYHDPL